MTIHFSKSYTNAIVMFPDQIQIFLVLHGPQETSRGCVWDLFDHCHLRHFIDNLHIHPYILELCEKVPCSISGQDQKDYQEGCAIKGSLPWSSSAQRHTCFYSLLYILVDFVEKQGCVCKRVQGTNKKGVLLGLLSIFWLNLYPHSNKWVILVIWSDKYILDAEWSQLPR